MNMKLFYAEKLVGNIRNFIFAVDDNEYELNGHLIMMYMEAVNYKMKLKNDMDSFTSEWTQDLKSMADSLQAMLKNNIDTLYEYLPHFNTVISGAYTLELNK